MGGDLKSLGKVYTYGLVMQYRPSNKKTGVLAQARFLVRDRVRYRLDFFDLLRVFFHTILSITAPEYLNSPETKSGILVGFL